MYPSVGGLPALWFQKLCWLLLLVCLSSDCFAWFHGICKNSIVSISRPLWWSVGFPWSPPWGQWHVRYLGHSLYGSTPRGPEDDSIESKHVVLFSCYTLYIFNIHSLSFFNLGARWQWVVNATTRLFYPRARSGTHCIGGWVGHRAILDGCGNLATTGLWSPNRAARSESLLYVNCLCRWWVSSISLGTFWDRILLDHDRFNILPNSMFAVIESFDDINQLSAIGSVVQ